MWGGYLSRGSATPHRKGIPGVLENSWNHLYIRAHGMRSSINKCLHAAQTRREENLYATGSTTPPNMAKNYMTRMLTRVLFCGS